MTLHSLDNLRCFLAAARLGNFTRAARECALTPAAFGQRIRQLEGRVGAPLFERTTRRVRLTDAGEAILPHAERCLDSATECVRAATGELRQRPLDLMLGTRHELGMSWLLPQFDDLEGSWPGLRIHLYVGSGPDLLAKTRSVEVDCAITSSRFSDAQLDSIRLHREDYVLCASRELLTGKPLRTETDAHGHTLLDISPDLPLFHYLADVADTERPLRFASQVSLGSIEAIRTRVLAGAGVAVLPHYLVRGDLEKRHLRRLLPRLKPRHDFFRLVFRSNDSRRPLFEALAHKLRRAPLS